MPGLVHSEMLPRSRPRFEAIHSRQDRRSPGSGPLPRTHPRRLGGPTHTPPPIDRRTEACLTCWSREPSRPRGWPARDNRGPAARIPRHAAGPHPLPEACRHLVVPVQSPPFALSGHARPAVTSCTSEASLGTGEHPRGASLLHRRTRGRPTQAQPTQTPTAGDLRRGPAGGNRRESHTLASASPALINAPPTSTATRAALRVSMSPHQVGASPHVTIPTRRVGVDDRPRQDSSRAGRSRRRN